MKLVHDMTAPFVVPDATEPHTDMLDTVEAHDAFAALLPTTGGDRVAAAILASAVVVADAISRLKAVQ